MSLGTTQCGYSKTLLTLSRSLRSAAFDTFAHSELRRHTDMVFADGQTAFGGAWASRLAPYTSPYTAVCSLRAPNGQDLSNPHSSPCSLNIFTSTPHVLLIISRALEHGEHAPLVHVVGDPQTGENGQCQVSFAENMCVQCLPQHLRAPRIRNHRTAGGHRKEC